VGASSKEEHIMSLENFSSCTDDREHVNRDDKEVRPRVTKGTHEKVRDFTSKAGLDISEGYDYLIGASLSDQQVLEQILTLDKEYDDDLTPMQEELLDDIITKYQELGRFPSRENINEDDNMNGFPIYIINLGQTDRIKSLCEEHISGDI